MSVPQVAKKFKTNMTCYARKTERVSEAFVDNAVTIDRRILNHKECRLMLEFLDNYCLENGLPHPFQSIYSLQAVCDRCPEKKYTGSAQITLVLAHLVDNYNKKTKNNKTKHLVDNYLNGNITISHFAVKVLRDPVRATLRSFTYALQCMHGSLTPTCTPSPRCRMTPKHASKTCSTTSRVCATMSPPTRLLECQKKS